MKKIKLDLDRLDVESFAVVAERGKDGTVHGHATPGCTPAGQCNTLFSCYEYTCNGEVSCNGELATCGHLATCTDCAETCAESCVDCV